MFFLSNSSDFTEIFLFTETWNFCVVPDLETMKFKVLSRTDKYEIREVEVVVFSVFTMLISHTLSVFKHGSHFKAMTLETALFCGRDDNARGNWI